MTEFLGNISSVPQETDLTFVQVAAMPMLNRCTCAFTLAQSVV